MDMDIPVGTAATWRDGTTAVRQRDGVTFDYPWHQWFAWRPVFIPASGWVWLRRVDRSFSIKYWDKGEKTTVVRYRLSEASP